MKHSGEGNQTKGQSKPLWQRLAWLIAIWAASVLTLALVAYLLRLLMSAAGLTTPE